MKRLMFMLSTEGKTPQQIKKEGWAAFQKYEQVEKQMESQQKASPSPKRLLIPLNLSAEKAYEALSANLDIKG